MKNIFFMLFIFFSVSNSFSSGIVLDDLRLDGEKVFVKIKNIGDADSKKTLLYLNDKQKKDFGIKKVSNSRLFGIIIDNSGSMKLEDFFSILSKVLFLTKNIDANDKIIVWKLNNDLKTIYSADSYNDKKIGQIKSLVREGKYTRLYDGIIQSKNELSNLSGTGEYKNYHPYLLIFSDGDDIGSVNKFDQIYKKNNDISSYFFSYFTLKNKKIIEPLINLTKISNGKIVERPTEKDINDLFIETKSGFQINFTINKNEVIKSLKYEVLIKIDETNRIIIDLKPFFKVQFERNDKKITEKSNSKIIDNKTELKEKKDHNTIKINTKEIVDNKKNRTVETDKQKKSKQNIEVLLLLIILFTIILAVFVFFLRKFFVDKYNDIFQKDKSNLNDDFSGNDYLKDENVFSGKSTAIAVDQENISGSDNKNNEEKNEVIKENSENQRKYEENSVLQTEKKPLTVENLKTGNILIREVKDLVSDKKIDKISIFHHEKTSFVDEAEHKGEKISFDSDFDIVDVNSDYLTVKSSLSVLLDEELTIENIKFKVNKIEFDKKELKSFIQLTPLEALNVGKYFSKAMTKKAVKDAVLYGSPYAVVERFISNNKKNEVKRIKDFETVEIISEDKDKFTVKTKNCLVLDTLVEIKFLDLGKSVNCLVKNVKLNNEGCFESSLKIIIR